MNCGDGKENISEVFFQLKSKLGTKVLLSSQTQA